MSFTDLSIMRLYRAADVLVKHQGAIEAALFDRVRDIFGFEATVTLYDLTNTYFEGLETGNPKAKRGHSKEKRSDCPLLTLGLILDGSGFVRRSQVFAGNAGGVPHPGGDALRPVGAAGGAGGDGPGHRHRGEPSLAAGARLPLSGGEPGGGADAAGRGTNRHHGGGAIPCG